MLNTGQKIIPILTSSAGSCLTAAEWQEVGVRTVIYYLDSLLLKPGLSFLKHITNLNEYLGWSGAVVLNASNMVANREGLFTVISPYDGSKINFSFAELLALIQHLKPQAAILPRNCAKHVPDFNANWNESIFPFLAIDDVDSTSLKSYGVYFNLDNTDTSDAHVVDWSHKTRYVMGDISLDQVALLSDKGVDFVETDQPAQQAIAGKVYSGKELIDLSNKEVIMQFAPIDNACQCPTCLQRLTRAYLHHLYHHTPLLCERFLLQHNIYQALLNKSA